MILHNIRDVVYVKKFIYAIIVHSYALNENLIEAKNLDFQKFQ